jgi:hypothetical protein
MLPTTPHNSSQNGRAEVSNYLVERTARTLMLASKVLRHLWTYAVSTAVYLLNLLPLKALGFKSPTEMLTEVGFEGAISMAHLRAYGCRTYVFDEGVAQGDKFATRTKTGKLVSYERGKSIYLVYIPSEHKVVRTSYVQFDESRFDVDDDDNSSDEEGVEPDYDLFYTRPSGGKHIEEPVLKDDDAEPDRTIETFPEEQIDTSMPDPSFCCDSPPPVPEESDDELPTSALEPQGANRRPSRNQTLSSKATDNVRQGLTSLGATKKKSNFTRRLFRAYMCSIQGTTSDG